MTVLALLVTSLSLTLAVTYLSIGESQSALALSKSEMAYQAMEGCAQDALLLSLRDENYTGGEYSYLGAVCMVDVSKDGTAWTLNVSSTKDVFTRSARIIVDRSVDTPATLTLSSWLEQ